MSQSVAANQFPQIVWRDGEKHLWNPIHKKALKNRPEERVRLRIIEYLIDGGWSKHRISTEEATNHQKSKTALRTDLICYTNTFEPFLLVECKAEQVNISNKTATQIARYNQNIGAPYLLMTNGVRDFWYEIDKQEIVRSVDAIPHSLPDFSSPQNKQFAYWSKRGFAGEKAAPKLRKWLETALNESLLKNKKIPARFLSFSKSPSDIDLNNYYLIYNHTNHRLALTFTATSFGGSRLIGILNQNGKNIGVIETNLDLLFDGRTPNASTYAASGTQNIDIRNHIDWDHSLFQPANFADQLNAFAVQQFN